jgi:hypothetical protein
MEDGKKIDKDKTWYPNGSVKEENVLVDITEVSFEGYNENGSKSEKMLAYEYNKREAESRREDALAEESQRTEQEMNSYKEISNRAEVLYTSGSFEKAADEYRKGISKCENNIRL